MDIIAIVQQPHSVSPCLTFAYLFFFFKWSNNFIKQLCVSVSGSVCVSVCMSEHENLHHGYSVILRPFWTRDGSPEPDPDRLPWMRASPLTLQEWEKYMYFPVLEKVWN